ncbi:Dynamin [Gracilaria domingensis]|nr:Dynamin [Gracilaria domingensis]
MSDTIDEVFHGRLGKKLALIEELRLHLGSEGIQCPGVLVVGAQSAGKSSVLERLTSIRFPRAQNTCTRVPTIVQLHTNPLVKVATALVSKNADFSDAKTCEDMKSVEDAILAFSSSIMENTAPISDSPIHIRYTRKKGPVMTLIDLPGITHVDVDGRDDFDIHDVTSSMVHKYVKNDNMVVLVVIPANDDFGNAEALRIAQLYDKEGKRTIGVVSKCDLVPQNSDILHKIRMSRQGDVKLALGFIAVRNKDIGEDGKDIEKIESKLFSTHELLRHLAEEQRGYAALTRKIVDLQSQRVDEFIPEAKRLVQQRIKELHMERKTFGSCPTTLAEKRMILTGLLCEVQEQVGSLIRAENVAEQSLNISSRSNEFCEMFATEIRNELPDILGAEFGEQLLDYVREASGYGLPNFISDPVFRGEVKTLLLDTLVQDQTEELICRSEKYMTEVYGKVVMGTEVCRKFEKLGVRVSEEISRLIEEAAEKSRTATEGLISSEISQIFN